MNKRHRSKNSRADGVVVGRMRQLIQEEVKNTIQNWDHRSPGRLHTVLDSEHSRNDLVYAH